MVIQYLKWNYKILKSFKNINKNLFLIILTDIIFYSSLFFTYLFLQNYLIKIASPFNDPNTFFLDILIISNSLSKLLNAFFWSFVIFIIVLIISLSIFKPFIYSLISKTKLNTKIILKYLVLNLILVLSYTLVSTISFFLLKLASAMIFSFILLIITIFIGINSYSILILTNKIKFNLLKIHLFFLPYLLIYIIFKLLNYFLSFNLYIYIISLFLFSTFIRYYLFNLNQKL